MRVVWASLLVVSAWAAGCLAPTDLLAPRGADASAGLVAGHPACGVLVLSADRSTLAAGETVRFVADLLNCGDVPGLPHWSSASGDLPVRLTLGNASWVVDGSRSAFPTPSEASRVAVAKRVVAPGEHAVVTLDWNGTVAPACEPGLDCSLKPAPPGEYLVSSLANWEGRPLATGRAFADSLRLTVLAR